MNPLVKINLWGIVWAHLQTFKANKFPGQGNAGLNVIEVCFFFLLPGIGSLWLIGQGVVISKDLISLLAASLSIFAALLSNVLVSLIDMARKTKSELKTPSASDRSEARLELLSEVHSTVSFEILLCVFALILLLVDATPTPQALRHIVKTMPQWKQLIEFSLFYICSIFLFTLLIFLKRLHRLSSDEFML